MWVFMGRENVSLTTGTTTHQVTKGALNFFVIYLVELFTTDITGGH
jgi:hypothetical protein